MIPNKTFQEKKDNLLKTFKREPHEWVPIMARCGAGLVAYAGTTLLETRFDKEKFRAAVCKAYEDGLPVDCLSSAGISVSPETTELFHDCVQTKLSADGVTTQHQQHSYMEANEYPQAIADVNDFLTNTMIRRKMPWLFEGTVEESAKTLEAYFNLRYDPKFQATGGLPQMFEEKYGAYTFGDARWMLSVPGDTLFDNFRGFSGTLTDLRRHYSEMKELCDIFWEKGFNRTFEGTKMPEDKTGLYMAHIPAFLNPKQFEDLCFKYFKIQMDNIVKGGGRLYILAEGSFKNVFPFYRDIPKDSLIVNVEDDDVWDAYKVIGDCQILCGGTRLVNTKLSSLEENKAYVKKAIETCAPGNAFIFGSDKSWCCKGDVTPTLVETFKYAREIANY